MATLPSRLEETDESPQPPSKSKKRREIEAAIRAEMQAALMVGMAQHDPPILLLVRALLAAGLPITDTGAMFGISEDGMERLTKVKDETDPEPAEDESE